MSGIGIGAAGVMGIAIEDLTEPVQSALATATTGGTITAGTYKYVVTAINAVGETLASNEQTIVTTGSTSTVTVTWAAVTGATGYNLYKTAAGGATGTELKYKTVGLVTSDVDTAPGSPAGALPASNTAYNPGTYVAPTKYVPFMTEAIKFIQATQWRRPIRQSAGIIGAVAGDVHIEGDIELEVLEDVIVYFLHCGRNTVLKSGSSNYTYTYTPTPVAIPPRTFSLTIDRDSGVVFGYVGCVVSAMKFHLNNGMLTCTISVLGRDEATQSTPTPTWTTTTPFGAGQYSVEFPTGTPVFDTDTFEFTCDDQGVPQYRMKNTGRGAQFINYGERNCTLHAERDFTDRTDYDNFKALTSQTVTITASKGANNSFSVLMPVAIKDTYEVGLSGEGALVRGVIQYQNIIDGTGKEYQITVKTQESL